MDSFFYIHNTALEISFDGSEKIGLRYATFFVLECLYRTPIKSKSESHICRREKCAHTGLISCKRLLVPGRCQQRAKYCGRSGDVYLRCTDVLAGSFDASCLDSALRVESHIPSVLDEILNLKDGWERWTEDV
jgi:hypothetical protein